MDRIAKEKEVLTISGLSRSSVYRLAAEGRFPRPVKIGRKASGWLLSDIQAWLDSLKQQGVPS